jgi:hypothetical protein
VTVRASAPQGPPTNGQFQVSADLAGFSPLRVFGSNQFVLDSTNIFLLGPNFSYSGPPRLTISRTPTNTVLISWPYPSPGYALQQNGALFSTNWSSVTNQVMVVGSTNEVIIAPPVGTRFYRLKQ